VVSQDTKALFTAWMSLGILLQAAFLIRKHWSSWRFFLCIGIGIATTAWLQMDRPFDLYRHLLSSFCIIFPISFALIFKDHLVPPINERVLLSYSLTFWYLYLSRFYENTDLHRAVSAVCFVPSIVVLFYAFDRFSLDRFWKMVLYLWFFAMAVFMGYFEFSSGHIIVRAPAALLDAAVLAHCLLLGMAHLILAVNAIYFVSFMIAVLPWRDEGQAWNAAKQEWKERTDFLTRGFNHELREPRQVAGSIILQAGWLLLCFLDLLPITLAISIMIVAPVFYSAIKMRKHDF